jgi:hypothetical protein
VPAMTKQLGSALYSAKAAAALVALLEEIRVAEELNGSVADRLLLQSMEEGTDSDEEEEAVVAVGAEDCMDPVGTTLRWWCV